MGAGWVRESGTHACACAVSLAVLRALGVCCSTDRTILACARAVPRHARCRGVVWGGPDRARSRSSAALSQAAQAVVCPTAGPPAGHLRATAAGTSAAIILDRNLTKAEHTQGT